MSIPSMRERKVPPTHPGMMLREDFLPEYGLTVSGFAKSLRVSRQTVNELLRERRAVSPEMALRLSRVFGNSPEFWLNAQLAIDLWEAARNIKGKNNGISPVTAAKPTRLGQVQKAGYGSIPTPTPILALRRSCRVME